MIYYLRLMDRIFMTEHKTIAPKEWLTLFEISQALSSTLVLEELLKLVLQSVRTVVQADRGSIMLFNRIEQTLSVKASFGMENKRELINDIKVEKGIAAKVIELRKPFLLNGDLRDHPQLKTMEKWGEVKSALSVPLIAKGEVVGIFNLSRITIENNFTEEDLSLISFFSGPVAIAINNAQLYNKIRNMAIITESERDRLQAILENISNGIIICNNNKVIPLINPMAVKILRIDRPVTNTMTIDELFNQQNDLKPIYNLLTDFNISKEVFIENEFNLNIKGESVYIKAACVKLFSENKKEFSTIIILEDHTRMIQTQKVAAWHGMARHLAHEIRNPLTPILWAAESLLDADIKNSPDFMKIVAENSNSIVKEVKRLQNLLAKFSSFAKMPDVNLKTDRIERVLQETIDMYAKSPMNIKIKTKFQPDIPLVKIDAEMIKQVLINIIKNAIEAMPMGGNLTITTVSLDKMVLIEIADTGIGIPANIQDKVFEPYFTTKESGTGLGLTICSKIISDHGGHMKIISRENEGTTVIIALPAEMEGTKT